MNKINSNNTEKNDEKELDSFFDNFKNTKFKKAIKKAQWKSILRNVIVSIIVIGVVLVGGSIANSTINYRLEGAIQSSVDSFNEISAPNKYIGQRSRYHNFLGGRSEYTTHKIIEGKVVNTGEGQYHHSLFKGYQGNWIGSDSPLILGRSWDAGDLEMQRYNELGQREMVFFYPFLEYSIYKNDLQLLDNIGSEKIMELALSFDQEYNLDEVKNLLPDNITIAWYWIDDLSDQEKEASKPRIEEQQHQDGTRYEMEYPAKIRSEQSAYGVKAYNANGEFIEDPIQYFFWALINGMKYDTRFKGEFERVYHNIVGQDGELTHENIKIWGVVVTGDVENLKTLNNLPIIKAASLGVVTEKY